MVKTNSCTLYCMIIQNKKSQSWNVRHIRDVSKQTGALFGFVPLTDPLMPLSDIIEDTHHYTLVQLHEKVNSFGKPNFLGAQIPVPSQLNTQAWKDLLLITGISNFYNV